MTDTIVSKILSFEWTSMMGIFLYWTPFLICLLGYSIRTLKEISNDIKLREEWAEWSKKHPEPDRSLPWDIRKNWPRQYEPSVTVGVILSRIIASVIPVVNFYCALMDLAALHKFFSAIGRIFSQPLVPKK